MEEIGKCSWEALRNGFFFAAVNINQFYKVRKKVERHRTAQRSQDDYILQEPDGLCTGDTRIRIKENARTDLTHCRGDDSD